MSDSEEKDKSQKTEEPTPHKLEQAFEKGQVALSKEINHWFILAGCTAIITLVLPYTMRTLKNIMLPFIASPHLLTQDFTSLHRLGDDIIIKVGFVLAIPFGIMIFAAISAGIIQTKMAITWNAVMPKMEKISPFKGFKRIFSVKSFVEFVKGIFKLILVSLSIYFILRQKFADLTSWICLQPISFLSISSHLIVLILTVILSILFLIAVLDFLYQKFEFIKNLKMTPEEVKKESKELDGDPLIKQRFRRIREARMQQNLMSSIPQATAIITNPTHYAVAIQYDEETMHAPIVIAKGQDYLALKIREIATANKIPIFEDPPLARLLFSTVELNQEILTDHYEAVAKIIQLVMKMKKSYF